MARNVKISEEELRRRITQDPYTHYAVVECYETLFNIIYALTRETRDKE
jgi:callose synthase